MDYKQSEPEKFIETLQFFNENLKGEIVKKAYISVGSHLFIKFGEELDDEFPNGTPCKENPWTIWLGGSVGWRFSRRGKYIVGSTEPYDEMNNLLQQLVGKKYLNSSVFSQFMDIQFNFEGGYQLTCFLKTVLREQWVLFCPNGNTAGIESKTKKEVNEVVELSKLFVVVDQFQLINLPIDQKKIVGFFIEDAALYLDFEDGLSLYLVSCMWRIEKSDLYCIGCIDHFNKQIDEDANLYVERLVGKKLIKSSVTEPFQDARFEFEGGYVIKTFSCFKEQQQWEVLKNNKEIVYSAGISLVGS